MAADQLYVHQLGGARSVTLLPDSVRFLPAFLFLLRLSLAFSGVCSGHSPRCRFLFFFFGALRSGQVVW